MKKKIENYRKFSLLFICIGLMLTNSLYAQNLLNGPNDIVFDEANNRYLAANWAGNSIIAIDLNGNQQMFRNNVPHAHGMECRGSVLYVASDHNLILINLSTAEIIEIINVSNSQNLSHITLGSSNFVYLTDWSAQKLFRVDLNNKTSTSLYSFSFIPGGVSYDENNNRLIILTFVNNAPILGYNLSTGDLYTIINTNIDYHVAICRDANSNYYITSFGDNIVYKFGNNFSTGPEMISTGHNSPSGLGNNHRDHTIGVTNYDSNSIDLIRLDPIGVKHEQEIKPANYILFQNYPNPFNVATKIKYMLESNCYLILTITDSSGKLIKTLVNKKQQKGEHEIIWDGTNNSGQVIPSGVYYCIIKTDNKTLCKNMMKL